MLCIRERIEEVKRDCLDRLSTILRSSSRMADSSSIFACKEVKMAGSICAVCEGAFAIEVSADIVDFAGD